MSVTMDASLPMVMRAMYLRASPPPVPPKSAHITKRGRAGASVQAWRSSREGGGRETFDWHALGREGQSPKDTIHAHTRPHTPPTTPPCGKALQPGNTARLGASTVRPPHARPALGLGNTGQALSQSAPLSPRGPCRGHRDLPCATQQATF